MKNSTKRKWKKGLSIRAAALTFFVTVLTVYGVGLYLFSDFVFLSDYRNAVTPSAFFLSPTVSDSVMMTTQYHRELPDTAKEMLSEQEIYGYTKLSSALVQSGDDAIRILEEANIPYEIQFCRSVLPEGAVVYIDYAGLSDKNGYYVNPTVPVILTLSGYKPEMPEFTGKNRVYLTFDDGPSPYTERVLDILGLSGVRAAFFTLGESIKKYPQIAERIVAEGHILASHGTTHKYKSIYAATSTLLEDVRQWQKIVDTLTLKTEIGQLYFRFPGGSVSSYFGETQRKAMIDGLHAMGYRIFDWNILTNDGVLFLRPDEMDSGDYIKQSFIETWETCTEDTRIILMHDSIAETPEVLPWIINYILEQGYTFGTLDMLEEEYFMG